MPTPKNGLEKRASGIGAVRKVLQDLIAPELKEHNAILRQHGDGFDAIMAVLHEQAVILREHGERLAKIEGRL
ncbi:MAG TPA: hypothetical protein VNU00_10900, partial [Candidatus Binataceae bacterium]|nr:hypothetical protein [Candidatus Binataceae bacterium]